MKTHTRSHPARRALIGVLCCALLSSPLLGCDDEKAPQTNNSNNTSDATSDTRGTEDQGADFVETTGCGIDAIFKGLEPTCANCHRAGKSPYFSSPTAFYNLLVDNPAWVTPGDPDSSELIALLEGTASGQYAQMPPGVQTFADMEAAGQTQATVAQVRAFITDLDGCQAALEPAPERVQVQRKSAAQIHRTLKQHLGLEDTDVQPYNTRVSDRRYPIWNPDYVKRIVAGVNVNPFATSAARRWYALGGESYMMNIEGNRSFSPTFGQAITQVAQAWCRVGVEKPDNGALFRHVDASNLEGATPEQIDDNLRYLMLRFWGHAATDDEVSSLRADVYDVYASRSDVPTAWVAVCATLIRDPMWIVY